MSNVNPPVIVTPQTPQQAIIKIVTSTNWLVTVGLLAIAIGVMTFLNGSTKGISIIGGGVALVAGVALTSTFFAVIAAHTTLLFWLMLLLITGGLVAFIITAGDINQDGKITWQDVRDLLRKK
jgi:hypothetical protein